MARQTPQVTYGGASRIAYDAKSIGSDAAAYHGDCEAPRTIELRGVESLLRKQLKAFKEDPFCDYADGYGWLPGRELRPELPKTLTVYVKVRCRKCSKCLWQKRRLWTAKSIAEVRQARRTWFVTLTVGPDRRFWAKAKASKTVETRRCERWDMLTPDERTRAIAGELAPEVTRWLKRVRKNSAALLRYLLVVEPHKDGFPHFHLLVHERERPVTKRQLQEAWKWGHSNAKLLDDGSVTQVRYCCKYLTKSMQTRVRASRRYGQLDIELVTETLKAATRAKRGETRLSGERSKESEAIFGGRGPLWGKAKPGKTTAAF